MENINKLPILVVGDGIVAKLTTIMLLNQGIQVIFMKNNESRPLNKIFAISPSSMCWFKKLGLPLNFIKSVNAINKIDIYYSDEEKQLRFDSDYIYEEALAYTVSEESLMNVLDTILNDLPCKPFKILERNKVTIENNESFIKITHKNKAIYTNICLWCDGNTSNLTGQFDDVRKENFFNQHAITFNFYTKEQQRNCAKQFFFRDSIIALLPISTNEVSVVWSCDNELFNSIKTLSANKFIKEFSLRVNYDISLITHTENRNFFPIKQTLAENIFDRRILLIGDAAHTIHPMAGQGLNMGIRDIQSLEHLMQSTKYNDIGARNFLRKYERSRRLDIAQFSKLIITLQWLFSSSDSKIQSLVRKSLNLVNRNYTLKNFFIRKATT